MLNLSPSPHPSNGYHLCTKSKPDKTQATVRPFLLPPTHRVPRPTNPTRRYHNSTTILRTMPTPTGCPPSSESLSSADIIYSDNGQFGPVKEKNQEEIDNQTPLHLVKDQQQQPYCWISWRCIAHDLRSRAGARYCRIILIRSG